MGTEVIFAYTYTILKFQAGVNAPLLRVSV